MTYPPGSTRKRLLARAGRRRAAISKTSDCGDAVASSVDSLDGRRAHPVDRVVQPRRHRRRRRRTARTADRQSGRRLREPDRAARRDRLLHSPSASSARSRAPRLVNTARTVVVSTTISRSCGFADDGDAGAGAVRLAGAVPTADVAGCVAAAGCRWRRVQRRGPPCRVAGGVGGAAGGGIRKRWNRNSTRNDSEIARRTLRSI